MPDADVTPGPAAPRGASTTWWLAAVVAVGVMVRVYPWLAPHAFLGVQEGDDGIYYAASASLLRGVLPYRDFTFVQPPGSSLLLLPFAATGRLGGDNVGLALARVGIVLVATANIVLVHRLLLRLPAATPRRASVSAVAAALVYALMPNAVAAEHTVLLEPLVNLLCLLAVTSYGVRAKDRPMTSRGVVTSGLLLAAAISVKGFAVAYVVALIIWLLASRRLREVALLSGGIAVGLAALVLPFALLAPTAFWQDVVITQIARPADASATGVARLMDMVGVGWLPTSLGLLLVLAVLAASLVRVADDARSVVVLWLIVGAVAMLGFWRADSYFPHYGAFLAPPLAVLVSRLLAERSGQAVVDVGRDAVVVGLVTIFALTTVLSDLASRGQPDPRRAAARIRPGSCVFYEQVSLAIAADLLQRSSARCPSWVDGRGVIYSWSTRWPRSQLFYFDGFEDNTRWQRSTVEHLRHADYLLLSRPPGAIHEWSDTTRSYALDHFVQEPVPGAGRSGPLELWIRQGRQRTGPASPRPPRATSPPSQATRPTFDSGRSSNGGTEALDQLSELHRRTRGFRRS